MNFKLDQAHQSPTEGLSPLNTLSYLPSLKSFMLYGGHKSTQETSEQQPKKKIAFKASKSNTTPTVENVGIYSIQEKKWQTQQIKGKIPTARTDYKTISMGQNLILYGGKTTTNPPKYLNDVYALCTQNWVWKKLFSLDGPPASQNFFFTKINNFSACSIVEGNLWILSLKQVNFQHNSNQLAGATWEKTNLQLPKNPLFCCDLGLDKIIVVGQMSTMILSTLSRQLINQFQYDFTALKDKKIKGTKLEDGQIVIATEDAIQLFQLKKNGLQKISSHSLQKNVKCFEMIENEPICYGLSPDDELISIEGQAQELNTMREINVSPNRNSCILEEQNQSSLIQSHEQSQLKIQRQESQINIHEEEEPENNEPLKKKLTNALTHQIFKRKLLEAKADMLENIIKKSEKFVLKLCKYGNQNEKKSHIEKVKAIRQDLQFNLGKETYYRKEIELQRVPSQLKKLIDQPLFESQSGQIYD